MRKLAILCAAIGIFALSACGSNTPAATPTLEIPPTTNPVVSATEGANTTNDTADNTLGDQDATFTASLSGGKTLDIRAPGRFACLAPTNQDDSLGTPVNIPGSLQISGFDPELHQVVVNLPFGAAVGEHQIMGVGGLGDYSVEVTLDPSDPNTLYRSTDGIIRLVAVPENTGESAKGSFTATVQPVSGTGRGMTVSGSFDFLTDDTSTMCAQ